MTSDVSDTALENIQSPQHSSKTLSSYAFPMPGCFPTKSSINPRDMTYPLPPCAKPKSLKCAMLPSSSFLDGSSLARKATSVVQNRYVSASMTTYQSRPGRSA